MPRPDALAGITIGKYKILRKIGRGGMAHVYLADDTTLSRKVALKVLDATRSSDERFVKRFQREARTAAQLNHPHIVTIYEVGEIDGMYYIAMEYLEGRPLKDIMIEALEQGQILAIGYTVKIIEQVANALSYAYETQKIVHRDIKPANVMVDDSGHVTLTDFGIARALEEESDLTSDSGFIGTPLYMSPEHIGQGQIGHTSDIYSLGIVLYQMLVGRVPFGQTTTTGEVMYKHVHEKPVPPRKINRNISPKLEQVVLKAVAKKPEKRFSSGREMAKALVDAYHSKVPAFVMPAYALPAAIGFLVVAIVAGGIFLYSNLSSPSNASGGVSGGNDTTDLTADINASPPPSPTIAEEEEPSPTAGPLQVVTRNRVHLRTGPGEVYDELGVLEANVPVVVTARNQDNQWLKINTQDGFTGWLPTAGLDIEPDRLNDLPVAVIPPTPTSPPTIEPTPTPDAKKEATPIVQVVTPTFTPVPSDTPTPIPPTAAPIPPTATPTETPTATPTSPPPPLSGRLAFPVDDGLGYYDVWIVYLPDGVPYRAIARSHHPNFSKETGGLLVNGEGNTEIGNNIIYADRNFERVGLVSDSPYDTHPYFDPAATRFVFANSHVAEGLAGNKFMFVQCSVRRPQEETGPECSNIIENGNIYAGEGVGDVLGEYPVWTHDGKHNIAFRGVGGLSPPKGIYLIGSWATRRDGGSQIPVLLVEAPNARPTDAYGDYLFFFTNDLDGDWEAYSIDMTTRQVVNLSQNPNSSDGQPTVSPDGNWVAFSSDRDGKWAIWVVPVTGGKAEKLLDFPKANPWATGERDWTTERITWGP